MNIHSLVAMASGLLTNIVTSFLWPILAVARPIVFVFLALIVVAVFVFLGRSLRLWWKLASAIKAVEKVRDRSDSKVIDLREIEEAMRATRELEYAWGEYAKTLHPQREVDDSGQSRVVRWRATSLAEIYFSEQAIIGIPLKADFYKHLPGISTGLGIIGTFSGLIMGLSSFDVADPAKAQLELKGLFNAVGQAFAVSAIAIVIAMLFTWLEKSLITARHRQVAKLRQAVDGLFEAGAGEEYLERLVTASETQATQATHIKDALVADLREILTSLTERQLEAQSQHAVDVGETIAERLGGPIADIAAAVKGVSTNQGEAVNKLLTDVLAGFTARMEDLFGGQMRGMTDLLKEASEAMRASAEKFSMLASDMDTAGKNTVEVMGERLNSVITAIEARQNLMNERMGEFVSHIRELVAESQTESARKLQETLGQVGEQVAGIVAELRRQAEESVEAQGRRQAKFEESTGNAVAGLSAHMEGLLAQSVETNRALQDTVARLSQVTDRVISSMSDGAELLSMAASDFAKAGRGVTDTMRAATEITGNIKAASATLSAGTSAAKEVLIDYGRTRETFAAMVTELKTVTESARRDASMTSDTIARIEAATQKLKHAQLEVEEYLKGVNEVLKKTHESFGDHVARTLHHANATFQEELRTAVDRVSSAIRDLGEFLEEMPAQGR